jgi:hypothetical protein
MSWLPNLTRRFKEIAANANVRRPVTPAGTPVLPPTIKAANEAINALPPITHPAPMRTSAKGLALIKSFESCARAIGNGRFEAYPDPAPGNNGLPVTIGWGSTRDFQGRPIKLGTVWTQEQCDRKKAEDMADFERDVRAILGDTPTTWSVFARSLWSDGFGFSSTILFFTSELFVVGEMWREGRAVGHKRV